MESAVNFVGGGTLLDDETLSLYRAYIRRLSDWVILAAEGTDQEQSRARTALGTAAPSEVKEAEALTKRLFGDVEPESTAVA
jgi:hypothetical protein